MKRVASDSVNRNTCVTWKSKFKVSILFIYTQVCCPLEKGEGGGVGG